ncbi:MAG: general secretion pathway protein GspC, partial [Myxococcota bacterium]|nr:general secretion pathway protein GspC [Myxococcota bacterium]
MPRTHAATRDSALVPMAIDKLLKRHFWAVILALLAIAALLDAQGIMQVVASGLAPDERQLATPPLMARVSLNPGAPSPHATSAEAILARNPFDSVTGPLNLPPPVDSAEEPPAPDLTDPFNAPECDGVRVLVITASADPDWSFAALETQQEKGKSYLRRRGGDIGGKTVTFVGWDRVWLTTGNQLCQAQMFKPPGGPDATATPTPLPAPPVAAGGATSVGDDIKKGIQRVTATEFNVDRGVVDKILENQAELMRQARIVPEQENGKVVGIRLFGVRPDTLLGALGMENGDRLEKINGFDMTSPEKALEAYARLRTADHLTVSV